MQKRPTFDDLQRDRATFIGPPEESRGPKMQRKLTDNEEFFLDAMVTMHVFRAAFDANEPIDSERLPDKIVEAIEALFVDRIMPVIDGRRHYHAADVLTALGKMTAKTGQA